MNRINVAFRWVIFFVFVFGMYSCHPKRGDVEMITKERSVQIAHDDAIKMYKNLNDFEVNAILEKGEWHIDFNFKNKKLDGGGPHYVIDAQTGKISSKKYEQ